MHLYWDTACLVKIYTQEKDSENYLARLQKTKPPLYSSVLASAELAFALYQKESRSELRQGAAQSLHHHFLDDVEKGRILLIPMGVDVILEASRLARLAYQRTTPISLRTLDGLHLATARLSGCRELLTTDQRMRQAASLAGLRVAVA